MSWHGNIHRSWGIKTTRVFAWACILTLLSACQNTAGDTAQRNAVSLSQKAAAKQRIKPFPLNQVTLHHSPFERAQQVNVGYLLALDADRLLAPYLREAGLRATSQGYGNWESDGLDGHIGGHYLSALSLAWAATGDTGIRNRLDYMLAELARAQQQSDGYLGGIPESQPFWKEISQGNIRADLFSLNERWVPLYNIDKIFNGLLDAYVIGEREVAKPMLRALGEWMLAVTQNLTKTQVQQMLISEHGGLNAVFADMAKIFNDKRYLDLADIFTHESVILPLAKAQDRLTGLHANTQIPKIIGALKLSEINDDANLKNTAHFFWQTVSQQRSVSIGGNSVREHFHTKDDFSEMIEDIEGPETCNTYNMLKLSKLLFLETGDTRFLAFYERATYNHILSSQHPEHGGLVYFTSMRPGHYRTYSSVHDSMWCCVGSGIENHSKYGELIYAHNDNDVWVNLFIPSTLHWKEKDVLITLDTQFPDSQDVKIRISPMRDKQNTVFTLKIRHPKWVLQDIVVKVNGSVMPATFENDYLSITKQWQKGDTVTFTLPTRVYAEQLPDGKDYYSLLYGPVVLATKVNAFEQEQLPFIADDSRMGHIAAGPVCPPEALPIMLGQPEAFIKGLVREPHQDLRFTATTHVAIGNDSRTAASSSPVTLIPFFRLHDARYQVYWPQMQPDAFSAFVETAKEAALKRKQLAEKMVDSVNPGEQQPEVEHDFAGEGTRAGINNGRHWRDAKNWFAYTLTNNELRGAVLRLVYFKGDVNREFDVVINDTKLASVTLPVGKQDDMFYSVDYVLPEALRNADTLRLMFKATEGSTAGGIYGIQLLASD